MKEKPLQDVKDDAVKEHLRFIQEHAGDKDVALVTTEPTTTTLKPGMRQAYATGGTTYIYENVNGNLFKYTLTAV